MSRSEVIEKPPALGKVVFAFSAAVPTSIREQLRPLLVGKAATPGALGDQNLTHVISPTLDFAERASLEARKVAIVTPQWAETVSKLNILSDGRYYSPDPRMFMSGCVICTTGLPPSDDLNCQAITEHFGGQFRAQLTREVTHLIAGRATGDKYERAVKYGPTIGISIVMPEWIWESFKVRRLIRPGPFLYPAPPFADRLLQGAVSAPDYSKSAIITASPERKPKGAKFDDALLEASLAAAPAVEHVFEDGPVVYLSSELKMDPKFAIAVRERVLASGASACYLAQGGAATPSRETIREQLGHLDQASVVICQQRKGWEYWRAAEDHKTIGNLTWLISIFATGVYTAPMAQPLHYPLPPDPIPGFDKLVITVGSYRETARMLIVRNIQALGAVHSGSANASTTHYILSEDQSAKAKHGRANGKPVVNHLWIDACLCQWRMIEPGSNEMYTRFGSALDLNSVVGASSLTEDDIDQWMATEPVGLERESSLKMIEFGEEPTVADSEGESDEDLLVQTMAMNRFKKCNEPVVVPAAPAEAKRDATSDDELAVSLGAAAAAARGPDMTSELLNEDEDDEAIPAPSDVLSLRPPLGPGLTSPSQHASAIARSAKPAVAKPTVTQADEDDDDEATEDEDDMVVDAVVPAPVPPAVEEDDDDEDEDDDQGMAVNASKLSTETLEGVKAGDSSDAEEDVFAASPKVAKKKAVKATKAKSAKAPTKKRARASTSALDTPVSALASASTSSSGRIQRAAAAKGAASLSDMAGKQLQEDLLRARERKGAAVKMNDDGTIRKRGSSSIARPTSSRVKRIKLDDGAAGSSSSPAKRKSRSSSVDGEDEGEVRVAWSGIDTLVDGRTDEDVIRELGEIGIVLDKTDIANATHFVLPNLMRTLAVLQAIPNAPHFVKTEWVKACLDKGKIVPAKSYALTDAESKAVEKKNKVKLTEVIARARAFKTAGTTLLDGHSFFVTPRAKPTADAIKSLKLVIRANGGELLDAMPDAVDEHMHVITDKADKASWPAEGRVYLPELVFASVFAQEFTLDAHVCKIR